MKITNTLLMLALAGSLAACDKKSEDTATPADATAEPAAAEEPADDMLGEEPADDMLGEEPAAEEPAAEEPAAEEPLE